MIADGLLEEVRQLYPYRHLNALNTVGYKELFDYLDHKCSLEESVSQIKNNTRHYAKRQHTWFKRDKEYRLLTPEEAKESLNGFFSIKTTDISEKWLILPQTNCYHQKPLK